jgi:cobalt-zinc-cadmium efflux system membrane fusion protein
MLPVQRLAVLTAAAATLLGACSDNTQRQATAPAKAGPPAMAATASASDKPAKLSAAQKQFLTIEAAGAAPSGEGLSLPGRVTFRPQAQSAVGATVAGRVVAQLVRAGEVVKAGTPVVVIESADASSARGALDLAATRVAAAETVYRRNVEMVAKGVGLELEKHEAEVRLKEARAEHERARHAVALIGAGQGNRVTVRAPTNGVVITIKVAVGATVIPGGEPLLELGDPSLLQVMAQVSESDARRLAVGQQAEVEVPALALKTAARVESISPRVDPESRRGQVYLALPQRVASLQAGMLAQINVRVANASEIALPVSAVLIKDGKRRVVYLEKPDGTFEMREVRIGRNDNGRVVILQGLSGGERVVTRGALLLDAEAEQQL